MNIRFLSRNAVEVETSPGEMFFYPAKFLRTGPSTLPAFPPFWSRCLIGRLLHRRWFLRHSPPNQLVSTVLSGLNPTGSFQELAVPAGEHCFVDLEHLAGFIIPTARLTQTSPPILHPVLRSLLRPASWAMGHPVPCVFEGPVTLILEGAALRWEESPAKGEYKPSQVVVFDAASWFAIRPMQPGSNWLSLVFNALTFESRFVSLSPRILVEDYIEPPSIHLQALKHFTAHAILGILLALILWLNR